MPAAKKKTEPEIEDSAYYFKWDGKELCIQDLPLAVFEEIERETSVGYPALIANPFRATSQAQRMLIEQCALVLELTLPPVTPRLALKVFDLGPDVVPDLFQNGVAVPKASASETTTT